MATHRDSRIKARPPPTDNGTGIFSRLLQRTRSKKGRKQADNEEDCTPNTNSEVLKPSFHAPVSLPLTAPPQTDRQAASAPPASTMGAAIIHQQQPPPLLKKRASIRDRFRSLAKDAPTPTPEPGKHRVVYVPTHAAADFSRLATPRPMSRQQQRHSYDGPWTTPQHATDPLTSIAVLPAEDDPQNPAGPRHLSPRALETLEENAVISEKGDPSPNHTTAPPTRVHEIPGHDRTEEARSAKEAHQPSDYELFVARAEDRERAHREHLLRTLSQRQYPRPDPRPEPEANQYHPRNSATYTADSAVVAEAGLLRKGWEGRVSGLDSGIGSKSSSQQGDGPKLQSEEPAARGSYTGERGHRKRSSWTPSFGAGGRDAERRLERGADAVPELDEGYRPEEAYQGTYTTSRNNASSYAERSYAAQQPRALKRQTSLSQKLGAYIRPARPPTRYEEPELTRGRSKRVP